MSNVELVESLYRAFAAGDASIVLSALDPEVEWRTPTALPWSRGTYRGPAEVEEYFASFLQTLDSPKIEPVCFVSEGDSVVAIGYERATPRATGRGFAARFAHVWTVDDGKILSMEGIIDTAAVLEAFDPNRTGEPHADAVR